MTLVGGGGRVTVGCGGGRRRAACGALPRAKCSAASAQAAPGKNHCRMTLNTASSRSNTRRWRRVRRAGERGAKHQSPTGTPRMGWRRAPPRVQRTNHHARRRARRAVAHGGDGSGLRSNGELFHSIGPFERTPRSSGLHRAAPSLQASPCAGDRFDSACSATDIVRPAFATEPGGHLLAGAASGRQRNASKASVVATRAAGVGGSASGLARATALDRMRWATHASLQRARRQTKAAPSMVGARRLVAWHAWQRGRLTSVGRNLLRRRGSMAVWHEGRLSSK
jgi:hypothetical protein